MYENYTFQNNDDLERDKFVQNIMQMIDQINNYNRENQSLSIALNSPWGTGKSQLIYMWKNMLESENYKDKSKYNTLIYNAWEHDDCSSALIPIVSQFCLIDIENSAIISKVSALITNIIKNAFFAWSKHAIGEDLTTLIKDSISGIDSEHIFEEYEKLQKSKQMLKGALCELLPEGRKLIVFIDELDRCRPTFAIETLEIIKHFFNIPEVIFIFSVDLLQLSYGISTIYGNGMDSAGYLRRFFDIQINIPKPENLHGYIKKIMFSYAAKETTTDKFVNIVYQTALFFNLTLRDINKILNNFCYFSLYYLSEIENAIENESDLSVEIYFYFTVLKYKFPFIYNKILNETYIMYDNNPKDVFVLDKKYCSSVKIKSFLSDFQNSGLIKPLADMNGLYQKYGFFHHINYKDSLSLAAHIQNTIEIFSSN